MLDYFNMSKKVTRLYEQFQPASYDLTIFPDKDELTFSGSVTIKGKKVGRPAQRITLHQKDLDITNVSIVKHDKKGDIPLEIARVNTHKNFDEVRLHTSTMVYPGNYTIKLDFSGKITRPMDGIYPCFFKHDGQDKIIIATQFESHSARDAFPCIDEPEAKATFDLKLVTPTEDVVLSNTPVKHQQPYVDKPGYQLSSFETTPVMSTYLLAFAFGDLEYIQATTVDGVVVRTYATPDNIEFTDFALNTAVKCLEFYNEYFDIPYPLAKCDLLAFPDFASGAMENWGLITFREQALVVDPDNTSLSLKQYVANVVAHELTHQWFGNLVTMRWWTDLWLNESFASWMSYLAVDHLYPDWKVWTQFIVDEQGLALKQDALEHTHPIEVTVNHPDEIRTIFDAISYEKGASVILMLHDYLGSEDFRDGLRLYLKRHAYSNTDTTDLWAALEEVSAKPVKDFMNAWTSQSGYPIVFADINGRDLSLRQERFYLNPTADKQVSIWPIPLLSTIDIQATSFATTNQTVIMSTTGDNLILNHNRTSFFRTIYGPEHLKRLADLIRASELNELDRLGILGDEIEAAKAGYGQSVDVLDLLDSYKHEDNAVVWDIMAGFIGSIRTVMDDDVVRNGLKKLSVELSKIQLQRLGWKELASDSHFDQLLRPTILGLASFGEEPTVVKEAIKQFSLMQRPEDIHPDLRGVIYGTVARHGDTADFDKMLKMHNSSNSSEERITLAGALTGFDKPALIQRALDMINSDQVRLQDVPYWIAYSFSNRHAKRLTWDWMVANWSWLDSNLGDDLSFIRLPVYAARSFSDTDFLPEYREFFTSHVKPAFERSVNQGIETIEWQSAWKNRDLKALREYFK